MATKKKTPRVRHRRAASPAAVEPAYFNRELSWLAFDRRVVEQAQNERHPLLERVRFLAISSSNLDEFFEIRVAGLLQQMDSAVAEPGPDGLSAREQLDRIHEQVTALVESQFRSWQQLGPALAREGILIRSAGDLSTSELKWARAYFREQVFPVLTPLALDQAHPFPQLGNKTLNVVVTMHNPAFPKPAPLVAILPVPRILPRLVPIAPASPGPQRFIFLSDIIKLFAAELFPGYRLIAAHAFRVTCNSDLYIDEEEAENLLKRIEEELRNLRRGAAVRLEIEEGMDDGIRATLCDHLGLAKEYAFRIRGPINLLRLQSLADIDRPDLKFPKFEPVNLSPLRDPGRIFEALRAQDVLLHHPYDSFTPVVDFVEEAARDPHVFAIKQTLYRTSGDSAVVHALIEASRNGKQVTALIELKARFDEANNIQWAKQLEEAGVHVVYGIVGLKIHCKLCLVVRREGRRLRHYAHLGTGNYNPRTARLYTDLSLFTSRPERTRDVARLFNALTGFGRSPAFRHLLVAPYNFHRRIGGMIAREEANALAGRPARIIAKMNSLVDWRIIDALYGASQAGVKIDLIVRGVCCLVPGLAGLSGNIRVRSIVGRFLEHARAFYFENAGSEPEILAGSGDWMPRNFFRRVEVVFPITEPAQRRWMIDVFFRNQLRDNQNTSILRPDGSYAPALRRPDERPVSIHSQFMADALWRSEPPDGGKTGR